MAPADPSSPRRVLVTGASGYVGRPTVAALAASGGEVETVVAFDVTEVAESERVAGVYYEDGDIRTADLEGLCRRHEINTVVHLAFMVRPPSQGGRAFAHEVDVGGTQRVLDACVAVGAKRLVVISSGAAYGYHADNPEALAESDPLRGNPEFPYSDHKRLVEELLADYRSRYLSLEQLVFRAGTIIGTETRSPITDLFEKPVLLGVVGSDSPFNFVSDEDVVKCLVAGVLGGSPGIYNLAGDGALTTREIAQRLDKPYVALPAFVLGNALRVLKAVGLTQFGPEQVRFLRYRPVLDNSALKVGFGYQPRYTSLEAFEIYRKARHANLS